MAPTGLPPQPRNRGPMRGPLPPIGAAPATPGAPPATTPPAAPGGPPAGAPAWGQRFQQQFGQPPGKMHEQWDAFRNGGGITPPTGVPPGGQPPWGSGTPPWGTGQPPDMNAWRQQMEAWRAQQPQRGAPMRQPRDRRSMLANAVLNAG